MKTTTIPDRFFYDDYKILSLNGYTTYIKKVDTERGFIYECVHREVITTLENINAVFEWIEETKKNIHT